MPHERLRRYAQEAREERATRYRPTDQVKVARNSQSAGSSRRGIGAAVRSRSAFLTSTGLPLLRLHAGHRARSDLQPRLPFELPTLAQMIGDHPRHALCPFAPRPLRRGDAGVLDRHQDGESQFIELGQPWTTRRTSVNTDLISWPCRTVSTRSIERSRTRKKSQAPPACENGE